MSHNPSFLKRQDINTEGEEEREKSGGRKKAVGGGETSEKVKEGQWETKKGENRGWRGGGYRGKEKKMKETIEKQRSSH